jgi:hypothetical protein
MINTIELRKFLDSKVQLSLFEDLKKPEALEANVSWKKIFNNLTTPKLTETKSTFLFGPYSLDKNQRRKNENVKEVNALVFDIDNARGLSFDEITKLCKNYCGIIHSTWSHTELEPRYRVVLPLKTGVPANQFKELRSRFLFVNPDLAAIIDEACSDISRSYYFFSCPPDKVEQAISCYLLGIPIDPDIYLKKQSITKQNLGQNIPKPISYTAPETITEGNRNTALTKLIGRLISQGHTQAETIEASLNWNQGLTDPLDDHEIHRTHESIWRTHLRNHPEYLTDNLTSTYDAHTSYEVISAADILRMPPPKREFLIDEFLPKKIVAALIAPGGTGKSLFAMHTAVALSSGCSLFGKFIPRQTEKVVFISGEDDKDELHRRLNAATKNLSDRAKDDIGKNLHFIDFADSFELLTAKLPHSEVEITSTTYALCETIANKVSESIGLVIVDPIARFRGGEENDAADTTRFIQALQIIRDQLNCSVFALHHANKGARNSGAGQNNSRGSSAFIDGVRLAYELINLDPNDTKKQFGEAAASFRLLHLNCTKSNYGKPIEPLTLLKTDDGALETFTMQAGDHLKRTLLQEIQRVSLTKSQFRDRYAGITKQFGLSEKAIAKKLEDLASDGLVTIPIRAAMKLTKTGVALLERS